MAVAILPGVSRALEHLAAGEWRPPGGELVVELVVSRPAGARGR